MNVSSKHIREKLRVFDGKWPWGKVSTNALLRDTGYWLPLYEDLESKVVSARHENAMIFNVGINELPQLHTGNNGIWDCDNYAILGCYLVKAFHASECRKNSTNAMEYAIFPMSRSDINHTQAICLTDDNGWYVVEFITGAITHYKKVNPKVLVVG